MNSLTTQSKKEQKRLYDLEYRRKNNVVLKKKKQAYYQTESGKMVSKRNRDNLKDYHLAYCRTEKYRALKKERDKQYLAKKEYGDYWECIIIIRSIEDKVKELIPDKYERYKARGYYHTQMIKRAYKRHLLFGWSFNH